MATPVAIVPLGDVIAASNTGSAAAQVVTTLPKVAGRMNYIRGFTVSVGLATAAVTTTLTISGLATANLVFEIAESTTAGGQLDVTFPYPIPASAINTDIVGTLAAITNGGAGSVVLYGERV